MKIYTMETSLDDAGQRFTLEDKLVLLERMDEIGLAYIDGGPPGEIFEAAKKLELRHARLCCRIGTEEVDAALESEAPGVIVSGDEERVAAAISELRSYGREVIFEIEDFFELFRADRGRALRLLEAAKVAGANVLCLADRRGETLPASVAEICAEVRKRFPGMLAVRPSHELAAACALEAIEQGCTLVAGPMALLATVAKYQGRLGYTVFDVERMPELDRLSRFAEELAGPPAPAIRAVEGRELLERVHRMQAEGYDLEAADGTLELIEREALRPGLRPFHVLGFEVSTRHRARSESVTTATVTIDFHDNVLTFTSEGVGPINAMDRALRGCLSSLYPALDAIRLTDYRVKVLDRRQGTASRVRVAIDWCDGARRWTTAGVSRNVVEASWIALADSVRLELLRLAEQDQTIAELVTDESWAV